jgi:hypothetical protein
MSHEDTPTLFDVALFLVCSSRHALDETLPYASMRMLDAVGRLLRTAPATQGNDAFFAGMLEAIDGTKVKVMHDLEGYTAALDRLQEQFIREAKSRNAAITGTAGASDA